MNFPGDLNETVEVFCDIIRSPVYPNHPTPDSTDLDIAFDMATKQFEDQMIWMDMRASEIGSTKALMRKHPELKETQKSFKGFIESERQELYERFRAEETPELRREMLEFVLSDFLAIGTSRLVAGRSQIFF